MIPRTLVPTDLRPAALDAGADRPRRSSTLLDHRTLVPSGLPIVPLEAKSAIPAHVPLDVLSARTVVPRDVPFTPLATRSAIPEHVPLTVLDFRIVVPKGLRPVVLEPKGPVAADQLPEVLEPDVLTTGDVQLLVKPVEERVSGWRWQARVSSVVFHVCLVVLVLLQPKLFPYAPPTPAEVELARKQLAFVYLPPSVEDVPKLPSPPAEKTSPQIRIDPRVLRQVAPPDEPEPLPGATGRESPRVLRELPAAPKPQLPGSEDQQREVARLETPKAPEASGELVLPRVSPGKALEDSLRGAAKGRGGDTGGFGETVPPRPGGGGGQGYLGGNLELLTPTEGVDFTNYLARVLASVKRNWYAVIPESARLGDRGKVVIQFHILRDGNVPYPEPGLVMTSGREPLDRAAMASIRASSPFEPLPPAFSGPFIELRFTFLYNLPLNYQ